MWFALLLGGVVSGLPACGDDAPDDIQRATEDETAGDTTGEDTSEGETNEQDTPPGANPVPAIEPPPPVLPGVDPKTPISELDEEGFEAVCDAYLDSAGKLVSNLGNACALQALSEASDAEASSDEEYRQVCSTARSTCEVQAQSAAQVVASLECSADQECPATLEQFDACNSQISVINSIVSSVVGSAGVPPCEDLTRQSGQALLDNIVFQIGLAFFVANAAGDSPLDDPSSCEAISEQCPGFFVPIDEIDTAF